MTVREMLTPWLAATALVGGLHSTALPALAADPQPAAPAASCVRGRDLMSAEERAAHRAKMDAATPEEQATLRATNHAEMQRRAAAKKLPLCAKGTPAGPGAPPAAP